MVYEFHQLIRCSNMTCPRWPDRVSCERGFTWSMEIAGIGNIFGHHRWQNGRMKHIEICLMDSEMGGEVE